MVTIGRILLGALCWIAFSLACLFAIPAFPLAVLLRDFSYAGNLLQAMDKLMAAAMGWDGDKTVSRECGEDGECTFCRIVCPILALFDPNHCKKQVPLAEDMPMA